MIKEYTQKNYLIRINRLIELIRLFFLKIFSLVNQKLNIANLFASLTSYISDISPSAGRIFANTAVRYIFANNILLNMQIKKSQKIAQRSSLKRILIISDLNIGDAVNIQTAANLLKKIGAQSIDYAINKKAYSLIKYNPDISNVFAIFEKANSVSKDEIHYLNNLIKQNNYDLVINFCPFLNKHSINGKNFINYMGLSIYVANNYFKQTKTHITYAIHTFLNKIFNTNISIEKNYLYLSSYSIQEAKMIYDTIPKNHKVIFFNVDATSVFTLVPFHMQLSLLEQLSKLDNVSIILSASFSQKNLQEKLYSLINNKKHIIPLSNNLPIDAYAALIDFCDCFISSDTGGLHIASSYKLNEHNKALKNKTAIFSIFGATPANIYSYDSNRQNFLKSSQDALSRSYVSDSPCKNITCINKAAKKCKTIRCFYGINTKEIVSDIKNYLDLNA
ncbi:MAG: glycosyltransferase family 9 protein [Desulfurella sp.]